MKKATPLWTRYCIRSELLLILTGVLCLTDTGCVNRSASDKKDIEKVTVSWFSDEASWGPSNWAADTSPLLSEISNRFGVSFDFDQPTTDSEGKLNYMLSTGTLPDMISVSNKEMIDLLAVSGEVYRMEDFLQAYDPQSHLLKDMPSDILRAMKKEWGDWYSIPSHMESKEHRETYPLCCEAYVNNVEYGQNMAIMFNTDIMDELGITKEDVMSEERFLAACETVKKSGLLIEGKPVITVAFEGDLWTEISVDSALASSFGIMPLDEDGNYRHMERNPGYREVLSFVNQLIRRGYLDTNLLSMDESAMLNYVKSGRVFCWIGGPAAIDDLDALSFTSFGPILSKSGAIPVAGINQNAYTGWIQTFVSKRCKYPEQVAGLLSFATSEEGLWLNYYGIKGEDYEKQKNGTMIRTKEGLKKYQEVYFSNMWLWPFNDTDFFWSTTPGPEGGDGANGSGYAYSICCSALARYDKTYIYDSGLFTFQESNPFDASDTNQKRLTYINEYLKKQKAVIIGAKTDEEFSFAYQNMMDTLYRFGIEEVDAALNQIYQENCDYYEEKPINPNGNIYH